MGANFYGGLPFSPKYVEHFAPGSQFDRAAKLAAMHGIAREECDQIGLRSQQRPIKAWDLGH